jgi:hypothetical protein
MAMSENPKILKVGQWKIIQDYFYKGELTSEILDNAIQHANLLAGKTKPIIVKARRSR